MTFFSQGKKYLLDVIFPKFCLGCGHEGFWLCSTCQEKIVFIKTQVCPTCGRISNSGKFCRKCPAPKGLCGIIVSCYFKEGPIKELVHNFKYNHILELKDLLGQVMASVLQENLVFKKDFLMTGVPLFWLREKSRGYNQSALLAQTVAQNLGLNYQKLLIKTKSTKRQVDLRGQGRRENLKKVFKLDPKININGKTIILVDDIATTGTTLSECARVLKEGGAKKIWGLVIARG